MGWVPSYSLESVDLSLWQPPVFFGTRPVLVNQRLYIFDRYDSKIKAYSISESWQKPGFLWEAAGKGDGPEEIPANARVNNLAIHPESGELWVSHRRGVLVVDGNGKFVRQMKLPHNESWVVLRKDSIATTSRNFLRDRSLITLVNPGKKEPVWNIEAVRGIPVTKEGVFIEENAELYFQDDHYLFFLPALGQLTVADQSGDIQLFVELPLALPDYLKPVDYEEAFENENKGFQMFPPPNGYSGILKKGKRIFVLTLA